MIFICCFKAVVLQQTETLLFMITVIIFCDAVASSRVIASYSIMFRSRVTRVIECSGAAQLAGPVTPSSAYLPICQNVADSVDQPTCIRLPGGPLLLQPRREDAHSCGPRGLDRAQAPLSGI